MKILAVSGSLSASSSNTALLQRGQEVATPPIEVELFAALDDIPNFSPERDVSPTPWAVASLRSAVRDADVVLIATPEYAGGMPGVLKNALDWLVGSGDLYEKRVVIVSCAPSAARGALARAALEQTVRMQGAAVCDSFTVAVPRDQGEDEAVRSAITTLQRVVEKASAISGSPSS